jgi:transcriptional regulator with XRE-family HTH domain
MAVMTEDRTKLQWATLATAIRAAREARGLSQVTLAELAGISEGSVQNLESGESRSRIPPSLAKVEPHLGWATGSGLTVLRGGEPTPRPVTHDTSAGLRATKDKIRDKYSLRIVDELETDDPLVDSAVIELPGINGARMTVLVHGSPDATPQEIQDALLAWRKAEQSLRRLPDDDGGDDEPRAANGS